MGVSSLNLPYLTILLYLLVSGVLAIGLWIAYSWHVRVLTNRIRNLLAERVSERDRTAREINDSLLQGVQGLILVFQSVAEQMATEDPLASKLQSAIGHAESLVVAGREGISDLRFPNSNLADALRSLKAEQWPRKTGYSVEVKGRERELQLLVCDEIVKIAREVIINAFEHAPTNHVSVTLTYHRASLELLVVDDGQSTSLDVAEAGEWERTELQDRVRKLDGRLSISTRSPFGAEFKLTVPAKVAYRVQITFLREWFEGFKSLFGRRGL